MGRTLWPVSVVLVAFAASAVGIGRVAAQQTAPGAAACTASAIGSEKRCGDGRLVLMIDSSTCDQVL
jgi:hypothetical protein